MRVSAKNEMPAVQQMRRKLVLAQRREAAPSAREAMLRARSWVAVNCAASQLCLGCCTLGFEMRGGMLTHAKAPVMMMLLQKAMK